MEKTNDSEHQKLSSYLKDVHLSLRNTASIVGAERAWQDHIQSKEALNKYAKYMEKLATNHWSENTEGSKRITWTADFCKSYFTDKLYLKYHEKEKGIAMKLGETIECEESFCNKIQLLDVGSCYNPFKDYEEYLNVTAIDLCPANDYVFQCDFLTVSIGNETTINSNKITELKQESFEAVVFSFLLEYIPTSELRILACKKAYSLLKPGGLLIVCTPDSKHVGANAKLMKCWRYTLAEVGFSRIQYNKYKFIHCMAFRKSLEKKVASRWAVLHREPYMEHAIHIPQDFNSITCSQDEKTGQCPVDKFNVEEMPFCNEDSI